MGVKLTDNALNKKLEDLGIAFTLVPGTYTNSRTKSRFKCKKCGDEVTAKYRTLRIGYNCPSCYIPPTKILWDIPKVKELLTDSTLELVSTKYVNTNAHLELRCTEASHIFKRSLSHLKTNTICPICTGYSNKIKWTRSLVLTWLRNNKPNIELLSDEFTSVSHHLHFKCKIDGHNWSTSLNSMISNNSGCPMCSCNASYENRDLQKELDAIHDELVYLGMNNEIDARRCSMRFMCKKHHHIFTSDWAAVTTPKDSSYCQVCNGSKTMGISDAKRILSEIRPNIKILSEAFPGYKKNIDLSCRTCGNTWSATFSNLSRGTGCPECSKTLNNVGFYHPIRAERHKREYEKIPSAVYLATLTNRAETFYKIGISKQLKTRFSAKNPYDINIIATIPVSQYDAIHIESYFHEICEPLSYIPKLKFKGWTECFSNIPDYVFTEFISYA